jgi:hypothetical protein
MTKSKIENTPVANHPSSDEATIAAAVSIQSQVETDDALNRELVTFDERGAATVPLSANEIEDRVATMMVDAAHVFFEAQQRVEGTNGKHYPLDYEFGDRNDDVTSTGHIVEGNRFAYLQDNLLYGVCNAFDFMLGRQRKTINDTRSDIQQLFRMGFEAGDRTDVELNRKEGLLAMQIEQAAITEIALKSAAEMKVRLTGKPYANKQQREAVAAARLKSQAPDRVARLRALGVITD